MSSTAFFSSSPLSSPQERWGKKNLFKYNSCLEGKISILSVSFSKLKSIGCLLKRHFFEAPACILCLTDVSINTWCSGTSQPTSEQSSVSRAPTNVTVCHSCSAWELLAGGILLADQDTPILAFLSGCLSDQEDLSSHGVSREGRVGAADHSQATGGVGKYPHTIPLQRVQALQVLCGRGVGRRCSLRSLSTQTIVGFWDSVTLWTPKMKFPHCAPS